MSALTTRAAALLTRIGAGSPLAVAGVWAAFYVSGMVIYGVAVAFESKGLIGLGALVWLAGFGVAYAIVTWYRDDDTVAAGFLLGVGCFLTSTAINLLVAGIAQGSVIGAAFAFGFGVLSLVVVGAIAVGICIALVWAGRLIHPGIATPVPPPRRHH